MTTGFAVQWAQLHEAAGRCRTAVQQVQAAAAEAGALEPSLGRADLDAAARRVTDDLRALLDRLAADLARDADSVQQAAFGYAVVESRVCGG